VAGIEVEKDGMIGDDCSPIDMDEVGDEPEWSSGGSSIV
jgi:hypothetical protein